MAQGQDSTNISTVSTGNSGNIAFVSPSITLGNAANPAGKAFLFTEVESGSLFSPGSVNFTAAQTVGNTDYAVVFQEHDSSAGITLNSSSINAGSVAFTVTAANTRAIDNTSNVTATQQDLNSAIAALKNISLVAGVSKAVTDAEISLGAASSTVAGSLTATASATSNAQASPVDLVFAVSVALANTTAKVTAAGSITTTGDVYLRSSATNVLYSVADATQMTAKLPESFAVAVGIENSTATCQVASTANLKVGGNLTVRADTENQKAILARSTGESDGKVGIAVAVGSVSDATNALLSGTVTVTGNASVLASENKDGVAAPQLFIVPSFRSGVEASAGVNTNSTGEPLTDLKGLAVSKGVNALVTKLQSVLGKASTAASTATKGQAPSFQAGAGVAVDYENNTATAQVGDHTASQKGTLKVAGSVTVNALMTDRPGVNASSTIDPPDPNAKNPTDPAGFQGSIAVAIGLYTDNAQSLIDAGASVDAGGMLSVTSNVLNSFTVAYGVNLVQAGELEPTYTTDDGSVTVNTGNIVEVKDGHTNNGDAGSWYQYQGPTPGQTIDLSDEDFSNSANWKDLGSGAEYKSENFLANLSTYFDDNLGVGNNLLDTWTQATSEGGKYNLAGMVTYLSQNQISNAAIGTGARVNQDSSATYRTGQQQVIVQAFGTTSSVNVTGSFKLPGVNGNITQFKLSVQKPGAYGTESKDGSVGAAALIVIDTDQVGASINSGAVLYADSLVVDGETSASDISIAASGAKSGGSGFNGIASVVEINNTTSAQIAPSAQVAVGTADANYTDINGNSQDPQASTVVQANDDTEVYNIVGGVMVSSNVGIGASVGIDQITRDTEAFIGNPTTVANHANKPTGGIQTLNSGGAVAISANNTGVVRALSLAAAASVPESPGTPTPPTPPVTPTTLATPATSPQDAPSKGGKYGIGVSGDVGINQVADTTLAYVHDAVVLGNSSLSLSATGSTDVNAFTGSASLVTQPGSTSAGIAGSYAENDISGPTNSFVDNSSVTLSGDLLLAATSQSDILAISASGSVANAQKGIAMAGQVSVNSINTQVLAYIADASVISANNVTANAQDSDSIFAVAGAIAYGGRAGVGASASVNNIPFGAGASDQVQAYVQNSSVTATGAINLNATSHQSIKTITAAVAASKAGMAVAIAVSINSITPDTETFIQRLNVTAADPIQAGTGVNLNSADSSYILAIAGGVGVTKGSASFGLALAFNTITETTTASLLNSTVGSTSGAIQLTANSTPTIIVVAAAGGAAVPNSSDPSAGPSGGAGAAAAVNTITGTIKATIDSATVTDAAGGLSLQAGSNATISAYALGAGGAVSSGTTSGPKLTGAGAGAQSVIMDTVEASIRDHSTVTVSGALSLQARDQSSITEDAGGFAVSVSKAGSTALSIGASVASNQITDTVQSVIDLSTVTGGTITLGASSTPTIQALTVAGSASSSSNGGTAVSLAGAGSDNTINDIVQAVISNSSVTTGTNNALTLTASDSAGITADAGGVSLSYGNGGAAGASPTVVDIENEDAGQGSSDITLGGGIDNPIGQTIIKNVRGNILTTGTQFVRSNSLDIEASARVGSASNRVNMEIVESVDQSSSATRLPILTVAATSGSDYLNITGRRRDGNSGTFTVFVNSLTAGQDVNVLLEKSQNDPASGAQDPGIFVNTRSATALANTTYDFRPDSSTGQPGSTAGIVAGGTITIVSASSTPGDPTINLIGTIDLTGSGTLNSTTNGNITYTEGSQSGVMRVNQIQSSAGNVELDVPYVAGGGQDLDLVSLAGSNGLIAATGANNTVLLQVGDNVSTDRSSMITAGSSITINADYNPNNVGGVSGSTISIDGSIASPLTNLNLGSAGNDAVKLTYSQGINSGYTTAIVNVNGQASPSDTLQVSDATNNAADNGVLTNCTITGLSMGGQGIYYANIKGLEVDLSQGGDTFDILSTHSGCPTKVIGGLGNDTINVSSDANVAGNAPYFQGNLLGILGTLTVDAVGGSANRIIVSNYSDTNAGDDSTIVVTNNSVTGFAPVEIDYSATGGNFTDGSGNDGILLEGSNTLNDLFTVVSTLVNSTTKIMGNGGADFFNVGSTLNNYNGNLSLIRGLLTIDGGTAPVGTRDQIYINDFAYLNSSTPVNANYSITPTQVVSYTVPANPPMINATDAAPARPAFAGINYTSIQYLRLDSSAGVDIYDVHPSLNTQYFVKGNLPTSALPRFGGGNYLQLITDGTAGRKLELTGVGVGRWVFSSPHKEVDFQDINRYNHVNVTASLSQPNANSTPLVTVRDAGTGAIEYQVMAYEPTFHGGVQAVMADMNGDGIPDLIVAPGAGRAPQIKIYNGAPDANGNYSAPLLTSFLGFSGTFTGGVNIAAGDVNRDGVPDLVVGAGAGWQPLVEVFNGRTLLTTRSLIGSPFLAFASTFRGGVNVAVTDVNGDGYSDIVTTRAANGTSTVNIFDGRNFALLNSFLAFPGSFNAGLTLSVGDWNGDGVPDIIVGANTGWYPTVEIFDGTTVLNHSPAMLKTFLAGPATFRGGIKVNTAPVNGGDPGFVERVFIYVDLLGTSTRNFFSFLITDTLPPK